MVYKRVSFLLVLNELIGHFTDPTAFADQKHYMDTYKKHYKLSVWELSNWLINVNNYTQNLSGSNGNTIYDNATIKYALFTMMFLHWKLAFAGSAQTELSHPAYTYLHLTWFVETLEIIHNWNTAK